MNLYKLSVILDSTTIERGVWADDMIISNDCYIFRDSKTDIIASFPVQRTFITSIETAEQVEERRKSNEDRFKKLTNEVGPR